MNDFSRTLSALVWESKILPSAVTVFSGGTEGVLCPGITFIVQSLKQASLLVSAEQDAWSHMKLELKYMPRSEKTVSQLINEAGIDKKFVHLVLIKCPLLTSTKVEAIRVLGKRHKLLTHMNPWHYRDTLVLLG